MNKPNDVERLAEALNTYFESGWPMPSGVEDTAKEEACPLAKYLAAQGFGHRDDFLRTFAEWLDNGPRTIDNWTGRKYFKEQVTIYLASLAAKPATDAKEEEK